MATINPEADAQGFIESKKGINLSIVSFGAWLITPIFFKITSVIAGNSVKYDVFCLFVSFTLSIIAGLYVSRLLYKRNEKGLSLAIVLNILLIYSSANGIQAGIAAVISDNGQVKTISDKKTASFLGFIDVRSWLPDLTSRKVIASLKTDNEKLQQQTDSLENRMAIMNIELQVKRGSQNQGNEYREKLLESLLLKTFGKVDTLNDIRQRWVEKEKTDPEFKYIVLKFRSSISNYLGKEYFDSLFLYEIHTYRDLKDGSF